MGAPNHLKIVNELSRQYTGLAGIPGATIETVNENHFAEGWQEAGRSLVTASKGVLGALTVSVPTMELILQRGSADPELEAQALNMLNAIKVLVATHSQIKLDLVASTLDVVHTRLAKEKRDAFGESTESLLWENLDNASGNSINTNLVYRGKRRTRYDHEGRPNTPYNRYRENRQARRRESRGSWRWEARQRRKEGRVNCTNEDYVQYGSIPSTRRGGHRNTAEGFQK